MQRNFQINLRGIIDLLSNHLYSGPAVFVRELLQNAVDALTARAELDGGARSGGVRVQLRRGDRAPALVFDDDGVGLTEEEVHRFLATIGESSKRRIDAAGAPLETDLLGQFGIGILACFLVSDEIVVTSRSRRAPDAEVVEWRGRHDGTYTVRALPGDPRAPGTTVTLHARADRLEWFEPGRVQDLLAHYGSQLRWPVELVSGDHAVRVNPRPFPWREAHGSRKDLDDAVLEYGRVSFGVTFLDWIPLRSKTSGTDGIAFVLPFAQSLAEKRRHRVYLKGMLVSDRSTELLPPWAFFVQCVLDSDRLRPTASREALYEDERLADTRDELGACVRGWLLHIAANDPVRLRSLLLAHHVAIRTLAAEDDEVLALFVDHLPFETTQGILSFREIRALGQRIQYASTHDAFRQLAPLANAQGKLLVDCGSSYAAEVLERGAALHQLPCDLLEGVALTDELDDLTAREQAQTEAFLALATRALQSFGCDVALKSFRPEELTAFYASSEEVERRRDVERVRERSSGLWADVLGSLEAARPPASERPVLCLNFKSPLIRRLASIEDDEAVSLACSLLYVHALLLGHRPLRASEQQLLPQAILGFISWGIGAQSGPGGSRLQ